MEFLDEIIKATNDFLEAMPKQIRKGYGQFFTSKETAVFMSEMYDLSFLGHEVSVLDPGAGSGILSIALIDRLAKASGITKIKLTCYETDSNIIGLLASNLNRVKEYYPCSFEYQIIQDNYILGQSEEYNNTLLADACPKKYDIIISNPPYMKIAKDAPEALAMPDLCHGAPNLYFLFLGMSLFNLKDDHELVYIIPRSWTSGAYFKRFRENLFSKSSIEAIHVFESRDKVFDNENVLQETMIILIRKTQVHGDYVRITSSNSNREFNHLTTLLVPYDCVVSGRDHYVFLPTTKQDVESISAVNKFNSTMPDLGLRMKTGIVVDFREKDSLRSDAGEDVVPLFYSQHIRNGRVNHNPSGKNMDWLSTSKQGLLQKNKNYIFCKRFTAKEEKRRLQLGIFLSDDFKQYKVIGTQNKINFIDMVDGSDLDKALVYGLYAVFNSTLYDQYYRIMNGSTQVNSTEMNSIPVPSLDIMRDMGNQLIASGDLSTEKCDAILKETVYEQDRRYKKISG